MTAFDRFPTATVAAGTVLHRIHWTPNHPAYFATGDGRFDPPPADRSRFGTCYLAFDPLGAYTETFGPIRTVPPRLIDARRISEVTFANGLTLADLTCRTIVGDYGVTAAHSAGPHENSRDLAAELYDAGFDGIRYPVRHDTAAKSHAVAVFGEPGEHPDRFATVKVGEITRALQDQGWEEFHIKVLTPASLP